MMAVCKYCGGAFSPDEEGYCLVCGPTPHTYRIRSSHNPQSQSENIDPEETITDSSYYETIPRSGPSFWRAQAKTQKGEQLTLVYGNRIEIVPDATTIESNLFGRTVIFCRDNEMTMPEILADFDSSANTLKINVNKYSKLNSDQALITLCNSKQYLALLDVKGEKFIVEARIVKLGSKSA